MAMFNDNKSLWVTEYAIGIVLLVASLPLILTPQPAWGSAHGWAYLLFIACTGIMLVGCASAMRQRIQLADRIEKLEKTIDELKSAQKQGPNQAVQKRTTIDNLVGSVN